MDYTPWIIMAVTGLIAGWLAGLLLGGRGLIGALVVGVIGSFVGGALINAGLITLPVNFDEWVPYGNQIIVSTVGAILVVIVARVVGR